MTDHQRLIALDKTFEETIAWLLTKPRSAPNDELVMALTHGRVIIRRAIEHGI